MPSEVVVALAGGFLSINPGASYLYGSICRATGAELIIPHRYGFGSLNEGFIRFKDELDLLAGDKPMVIIGHSLGAINAVRYAAHNNNVTDIMLIGMPVRGTALCRIASPVRYLARYFAPILEDLAPNSEFLDGISSLLPQVRHKITCVHARRDYVVTPSSSAYIELAKDYLYLDDCNHVSMVIDSRVIKRAKEIVEEANRSLIM